jgi:hypothetical protein
MNSHEKKNEIVVYQADKFTSVEVKLGDDTVWLNRNQIASLFNRDVKTIGKHIINVCSEAELDKEATVANFATVQKEGDREVERQIEHYNLDVIISVGYRVKSKQGTQFRIWANKILKDYLLKGYASKMLMQDLEKHNAQYPKIEIDKFDKAHDRFLIIDETTIYHFGASLKDLGKKWFAFSKMEMDALEMITNFKKVNLYE